MKFLIFSIIVFSTSAIVFSNDIVSSKYILPNQTFLIRNLTAEEMITPIENWATNYFIPEMQDGSGDIPMRDVDGIELGPKLSLHDWCHSALEGSVKINFKDGTSKVFNYFGNSELTPVDCSTILPFDLSKTKFKKSKSIFGEGTKSYNLIPYRTIATDHERIPSGTVLFIPEARGNIIKIGDETIIHDGYFFVGDRGGAIKDNHIDVFTGIHQNPKFFPWIGHNLDVIFKAYIVTDQKIINELKELHLKKKL